MKTKFTQRFKALSCQFEVKTGNLPPFLFTLPAYGRITYHIFFTYFYVVELL